MTPKNKSIRDTALRDSSSITSRTTESIPSALDSADEASLNTQTPIGIDTAISEGPATELSEATALSAVEETVVVHHLKSISFTGSTWINLALGSAQGALGLGPADRFSKCFPDQIDNLCHVHSAN